LPPLSYQGWGYQQSPYENAYAASSGADVTSQSIPSPEGLSGEGKAPKKHTGWWILLTLVGLLVGVVFYFFGEMFEYGSERLIWTLIKCAVALVPALAMIPLFAAARRNSLMASAQGNEELVQTRKRGQVMVACVGLGLCLYALSNSVPAVLYMACALRSGNATMTIDYYTHSKAIASARINN